VLKGYWLRSVSKNPLSAQKNASRLMRFLQSSMKLFSHSLLRVVFLCLFLSVTVLLVFVTYVQLMCEFRV